MAPSPVLPETAHARALSAHLRRSLMRHRELGTARPMEGRKAGYGEGSRPEGGPCILQADLQLPSNDEAL